MHAQTHSLVNSIDYRYACLEFSTFVYSPIFFHYVIMCMYQAGDFASEISRGQVGFPRRDARGNLANHHLASTDVTREKANVYSLKVSHTPCLHVF